MYVCMYVCMCVDITYCPYPMYPDLSYVFWLPPYPCGELLGHQRPPFEQSDQICPKMWPNPFLSKLVKNFKRCKNYPKIWATPVIFENMPKVNKELHFKRIIA
jgi:hypothetical protein